MPIAISCARPSSVRPSCRTRNIGVSGWRLKSGLLTVQAHNPEQEEAEDQVEVEYQGEDLEIGFNVNYLLDALGALDGNTVEIGLSDANSSCLVRLPDSTDTKYVVMPMRL